MTLIYSLTSKAKDTTCKPVACAGRLLIITLLLLPLYFIATNSITLLSETFLGSFTDFWSSCLCAV
jgi:hypothetical protein